MFINKQTKQSGFTLIEMLVSITLLSMVLIMTGSIFIMINRDENRNLSYQKIQGDARLAIESIAKEIRLSKIDYVKMTINNPMDEIKLEKPSGELISFKKATGSICGAGWASTDSCVLLSIDADLDNIYETTAPITSKQINISSLQFYVFPKSSTNNGQPWVLISLVVQGKGQQASEKFILPIQTTVSSRDYTY